MVSRILIAVLPSVIFSCCLWLFSICSPSCFSVHLQKVWLFPFFKYHKWSAPIFWPWFPTSCPKSLRQVVGDWAARVGSVGSRRFSMRARSSDRETAAPQIEKHNPARNTTQQHNPRPTTQHNTTTTATQQHHSSYRETQPGRADAERGKQATAHLESSSRGKPPIWTNKKCEDVWSKLSTYQASRWSISLSRKDQSVSTWAGSEEN